MTKSRNSSVELLRILSMFFIVCSHFCAHGDFATTDMNFSFNKIILQIGTLGNLGVAIFVMISGYFLSATKFKISRIVKLLLQITFYSAVIYFGLVAFNVISFSWKGTISALLPVIFNEYWFATAYIVFCLFTPYINKLLNGFSKKQYLVFIGILLCIWSILPTLTRQSMGSSDIAQFLMFYSIGAFVRKYPDLPFAKKYRYWIAGVSALLLIASTVVFNLLAIKIPFFNKGAYFYTRHSVLVVALAYGLLLVFTNMKPRTNRFINAVSSTVFGVYLIHDNNYLRSILWKDILHVEKFATSPYLILYWLGCIIAVFTVCALIDFIRQKLIEKPVLSLLSPPFNHLIQKTKEKIEQEETESPDTVIQDKTES